MSVTRINRGIIATALVGILVSTYALYVEMAAEARPGYQALCDLSEHASCTRVLTSEFSKGFGFVAEDSTFEVPNCIYGIVFYCIIIYLSTFDNAAVVRLQQFLCLASVVSCVYLGYLLLFVLFDFCIVCVSTYIVNGMLLVFVNKKKDFLATKNK
ncbi:PREDICTED: vitamin K epoxide reductase complex subunit 1-like protein 1 [Papilio polytes]|uniref:vitamin K epoxide reductase complex subunit 1-like protein 1 n=1 Tax=Papilio polytes TaxID=76194 RepID=UPI000675DA03|nr:PREDICTED: vitamin K epoxide reductase complex subunit 1-like protein 1 [Papilio polytes]XP_013145267.1 PREDICTED: vitamin K epoxide reductase complex subunit 1-like protein 1 [Papilio polytes]